MEKSLFDQLQDARSQVRGLKGAIRHVRKQKRELKRLRNAAERLTRQLHNETMPPLDHEKVAVYDSKY